MRQSAIVKFEFTIGHYALTIDSMKSELGQWLDRQFLHWQMSQGGSKTIVEFAKYLEVSRDALYKWMNGNRLPDLEYVQKISDKLGPEIYDLAGLPRPNERLQRIKQVWDSLSEEEQEDLAARIEQSAEERKKKLVEQKKRERVRKATPVTRSAK